MVVELGNNVDQANVPVLQEQKIVPTAGFVFNSTSEEWEPAGPGSASPAEPIFAKGTVLCNLLGDNEVYACPVGQKLRLYYFGYSAGSNVGGVLAKLQLQGAYKDSQYLITPGQPFSRNIQAGTKKNYIDGNTDEDLIVNLSAAQTVYVNYELEVI